MTVSEYQQFIGQLSTDEIVFRLGLARDRIKLREQMRVRRDGIITPTWEAEQLLAELGRRQLRLAV
jgi:hypothetical protein